MMEEGKMGELKENQGNESNFPEPIIPTFHFSKIPPSGQRTCIIAGQRVKPGWPGSPQCFPLGPGTKEQDP
jgi:hypothetical protein